MVNGEAQDIELVAEVVLDGRLVIPIGQKPPLSEAAKAQAAAEKGASGKALLVAQIR
jgi:NADPH:quinone reductase-like Zn-dependent oxidoreductase